MFTDLLPKENWFSTNIKHNNNSNSNNSNNNNNNNDNDDNKVRLQIYQPFSVALLTIKATASFGNESCTFVLIGIHSMQG